MDKRAYTKQPGYQIRRFPYLSPRKSLPLHPPSFPSQEFPDAMSSQFRGQEGSTSGHSANHTKSGSDHDSIKENQHEHSPHHTHYDSAVNTEFAPVGVNRVESFYAVFNNRWRLTAFWVAFMIFFCAYALSADTTYVYLAFATSAFEEHSLIGTIAVLVAVVAAILPPFWAKAADFTSRPMALLAGLVLYTVGYAITAGSNTVQAVAAGQVLYTVGNSGLSFIQSLLIADVTSMRYRGLANGATSMPYILFAFVSGYITEGISLANWRWGYGMFCILVPVCLVPILFALFWSEQKAKKKGVLSVAASSMSYQLGLSKDQQVPSLWTRIRTALSVIDALGLILLGFCFALLLTPSTLSSTASGGWSNPSLIAMQTIGGVLFFVFAVYEWKVAKHPLMPLRIWNKTFTLVVVSILYFIGC